MINGKTYNTSEHYYQSEKFNDPTLKQRIIDAPTPAAARNIAQANINLTIPTFHAQKNDIMLKALRAKFSQHPSLGNQLLATGDRQLIEHTANDNYWGDGGDGTGANNLGKLLMQVRSELRNGTITYINPYRG